MEESFFGKEEFKSIVLGDFNLQPYSRGIMGYDSFNATMSVEHALKGYRIIKGKKKLFYYNPMWKMMGKNKLVQGTYYRNRDSEGLSVYWYTFDEVLLRPYFIKKFEWTSFKILEGTNNRSFVKGNKINSKVYSDHLPIMFEVMISRNLE